jgi:hypothetical protein
MKTRYQCFHNKYCGENLEEGWRKRKREKDRVERIRELRERRKEMERERRGKQLRK